MQIDPADREDIITASINTDHQKSAVFCLFHSPMQDNLFLITRSPRTAAAYSAFLFPEGAKSRAMAFKGQPSQRPGSAAPPAFNAGHREGGWA